VSVNELLAARGMPGEYLVFHLGLGGLTAVRLTDRCYVQLDADDFSERAVFPTFDEWYRGVLRAEYAARYGLAPLDLHPIAEMKGDDDRDTRQRPETVPARDVEFGSGRSSMG
jgi:hypothetical protein